jgi:hypothetical protein
MAACSISSVDSTAADMQCVLGHDERTDVSGGDTYEFVCDKYVPKTPLPTVTP